MATYERTRSYAVSVAPEVRSVVVAGETKAVQGREFQLTGLEFCREETEQETLFDGLTRAQNPALGTYLQFQATPADAEMLSRATQAGTVVVPPEVKASALVREVVSSAIGRIEADRILEERVTVDTVDLLYRPVYAFRYRHAGKEAVIEFDGLTGDARAGGDTSSSIWGKYWSHDSSLTRVSRP